MRYLLNVVNTYRVPTVEDALELRDELSEMPGCELVSFQYTTKQVKGKSKEDFPEEYQVVKAKLQFNSEKEPEQLVVPTYEVEF